MRTIKIPVENVVGFTIADIYVDVNISLRPMSVPSNTEQIAFSRFNSLLGSVSWEIKQDILKKLDKILKEAEEKS